MRGHSFDQHVHGTAALLHQLSVHEGAQEEWRIHFRVAGKSFRERSRRIGLACQNLRAAAVAVAQWAWIMVRQGLVGPPRLHP
jgi:hypothetical protein